jgi:hypothetical protein
MDVLTETRRRLPALARYIERVMEAPLVFEGDDPNLHSADNHVHLFMLEYLAEEEGWIDLGLRTRIAEALLDRWRSRLRGMMASSPRGFRLYLYQDLAPTISAVAETDTGFPYPPRPVHVDTPREIMALYDGRRWSGLFSGCGRDLPGDRQILDAIDGQAGSIGRPAAEALGMRPGDLRKLIECADLQDEVNAIRKRHKRRPARFRSPYELPHVYRIYEERVTP